MIEKFPKKFALLSLCASLSMIGTANVAHAQADYPNQAIRVIVPFAPGGSTDIVARIVTKGMSEVLGQSMVVENKGGAGGAIGAAEAARAKPDGYTLSIATISTLAVNPACRPNDLPYASGTGIPQGRLLTFMSYSTYCPERVSPHSSQNIS